MKIVELAPESVKVGLRVKSVSGDKLGTVVRVEPEADSRAWILWDKEYSLRSAFYGNDCQCEVVEENK